MPVHVPAKIFFGISQFTRVWNNSWGVTFPGSNGHGKILRVKEAGGEFGGVEWRDEVHWQLAHKETNVVANDTEPAVIGNILPGNVVADGCTGGWRKIVKLLRKT